MVIKTASEMCGNVIVVGMPVSGHGEFSQCQCVRKNMLPPTCMFKHVRGDKLITSLFTTSTTSIPYPDVMNFRLVETPSLMGYPFSPINVDYQFGGCQQTGDQILLKLVATYLRKMRLATATS